MPSSERASRSGRERRRAQDLSKAIGLAGLRVGFMLAAPRIVEGVARMRSAAAVSRLGLAAATYCYSPAGQAEVGQRLTYLITERERIRTELLAAGVPVPDSDASFVWLPVGDKTAELNARIAMRESSPARSTARVSATRLAVRGQ